MKIRLFALSSPPNPAVYSNYKSNMASRINDREPITSARINKTPAMQANLALWGFQKSLRKHKDPMTSNSFIKMSTDVRIRAACALASAT